MTRAMADLALPAANALWRIRLGARTVRRVFYFAFGVQAGLGAAFSETFGLPSALKWLDEAAIATGRTHPTFVEVGTNKPLYVHRRGSKVVNGQYYVAGEWHDVWVGEVLRSEWEKTQTQA